jgi:ankyrin repeat protein
MPQDLAAIDLLLDAGADINAKDPDGTTPLHLAVDSELDLQGREEPPDRCR